MVSLKSGHYCWNSLAHGPAVLAQGLLAQVFTTDTCTQCEHHEEKHTGHCVRVLLFTSSWRFGRVLRHYNSVHFLFVAENLRA
jgi:hypothetical protein